MAGRDRFGGIAVTIWREPLDEYAEQFKLVTMIDAAAKGVYLILSVKGQDKRGNVDTYVVVRASEPSQIQTVSESELAEIIPQAVKLLEEGAGRTDMELIDKAFDYFDPDND